MRAKGGCNGLAKRTVETAPGAHNNGVEHGRLQSDRGASVRDHCSPLCATLPSRWAVQRSRCGGESNEHRADLVLLLLLALLVLCGATGARTRSISLRSASTVAAPFSVFLSLASFARCPAPLCPPAPPRHSAISVLARNTCVVWIRSSTTKRMPWCVARRSSSKCSRIDSRKWRLSARNPQHPLRHSSLQDHPQPPRVSRQDSTTTTCTTKAKRASSRRPRATEANTMCPWQEEPMSQPQQRDRSRATQRLLRRGSSMRDP